MSARRAAARQPHYDPATLRLLLETALAQAGHPPTVELVFARPRRWRFDYCFPGVKLAVELEGGIWGGGRHITPAGFLADLEKYNAATLLGWRLLRITYDMIESGAALALIERALGLDSTMIPETSGNEAAHERRPNGSSPRARQTDAAADPTPRRGRRAQPAVQTRATPQAQTATTAAPTRRQGSATPSRRARSGAGAP